ncbi:MAG: TolC family protein [Myxococcota bacterium]|jgi:cobalt-zinc-cadmium efflux system outer membrane protein|nr:TolC family protein [Myxococcota bacterium]
MPPSRTETATAELLPSANTPAQPVPGRQDPSVHPSSESVSLGIEAILEYADAHAPVLLSARAQAELAQAQERGAELVLKENPELELSAGLQQAGSDSAPVFELTLSQRFEFAGESRLRLETALAAQRNANAQLQVERWSLRSELYSLYVELLLSREQVQLRRRFADFYISLQQILSKQAEAGELDPIALLAAETEFTLAQEALLLAQQQETRLHQQLVSVAGYTGDPNDWRIEGTLPSIQDLPELATLRALMRENHPAFQGAASAVELSQSQLALQEREAWPEPSLSLSYSRENGLANERDANTVQLGLSLPLPFWQLNQEARALAETQLSLAQRQQVKTVQQLVASLELAYLELEAAHQRLSLFKDSIFPSIDEQLALLQRAYQLGELDLYEASRSRETLLQASERYLQALGDYHRAANTLNTLGMTPPD